MKRNTKRFAIAAAALTLVAPFAATAAYADPGQYNGHGYSDNRDNNRHDRNDRNDRNSYNQRGNDNRGAYQGNWNNQYQGQNNWRRGDHYDRSRFSSFDYRREHYREPPRGYRYVRDDRGDTLLVGILSGVILSAIVNNHGDRY